MPQNIFIKTLPKCFLGVVPLFVCTLLSTSCKKFVEVDPPVTSITGGSVYSTNATAAAVLTGIYATIGGGSAYMGANGISLRTGLSADELVLFSGGFNNGSLQQLYQNNLLAQTPIQFSYWQEFYKQLLTINSALEGLEASSTLTPGVKKQLLGEAKFLRAFFHFYLVNFYGDVPLSLTSDWRINAVASRTPKTQVYELIIKDLKEAQELLSSSYLKADALTAYSSGSEIRIRPTKWAATALLARAYLYSEKWSEAEAEATALINNNAMYSLNTLDLAFSKNNKEAIWQIQYVNNDFNTEGYHFILTGNPNFSLPTYLSTFLLNEFEPGDQRKVKWVSSYVSGATTYYFPYKYKAKTNPNNTEYFMVLRLAEQYLIRAEARTKQNKLIGANSAESDINAIRQRAVLSNTSATTQPALLTAIAHERQVELFTEWGHRWFDLKRTGKIDAVMNTVLPVKRPGFTWNTNWQLYPLSTSDIQLNPNLGPNNPGY